MSRVTDRERYRELSQGDYTVDSHPENSYYLLSKVDRRFGQFNLSLLISDIGQWWEIWSKIQMLEENKGFSKVANTSPVG